MPCAWRIDLHEVPGDGGGGFITDKVGRYQRDGSELVDERE